MSKPKRKQQKQQRQSIRLMTATFAGTIASAGLLYFVGKAFMTTLASFRSCSANDNGLRVVSCGKGSPNIGDFIMFALFALTACLVVTLATASLQMINRMRAK